MPKYADLKDADYCGPGCAKCAADVPTGGACQCFTKTTGGIPVYYDLPTGLGKEAACIAVDSPNSVCKPDLTCLRAPSPLQGYTCQ